MSAPITSGGAYPAEHAYRFAPGSDGPTDYSCGDCGLESTSFVHTTTLRAVVNALDAYYHDNHNWSTRPCETCWKLSQFFGQPFGCYRWKEERPRRVMER